MDVPNCTDRGNRRRADRDGLDVLECVCGESRGELNPKRVCQGLRGSMAGSEVLRFWTDAPHYYLGKDTPITCKSVCGLGDLHELQEITGGLQMFACCKPVRVQFVTIQTGANCRQDGLLKFCTRSSVHLPECLAVDTD